MVPSVTGSRQAAVRRVLLFVLAANLAVVAAKLWVGIRAGSIAVLGDAAHSGVDALNNVVGLAAIRAASAPPDEDHPYGHAKFELLGAVAVVVFLSITCFELVTGSIARLLGDSAPPQVESVTFAVLIATMVTNIAVAGLEGAWARRLRSVLLSADARHTMSDVLVTISVIGGLFLVQRGWTDADAWLGIVVAGLIARSGWKILAHTVPALVDSAAVEAGRIRRFVEDMPGVHGVRDVRSRGSLDGDAFVELTVTVEASWTVEQGHRVADAVERRLTGEGGFAGAVVHVEPWNGRGTEATSGAPPA